LVFFARAVICPTQTATRRRLRLERNQNVLHGKRVKTQGATDIPATSALAVGDAGGGLAAEKADTAVAPFLETAGIVYKHTESCQRSRIRPLKQPSGNRHA
jgi:hypothetical protein